MPAPGLAGCVADERHLPEGRVEALPFDLRHRRILTFCTDDHQAGSDGVTQLGVALRGQIADITGTRHATDLLEQLTGAARGVLESAVAAGTDGEFLSGGVLAGAEESLGLTRPQLRRVLTRLANLQLIEYDDRGPDALGVIRLKGRGVLLVKLRNDGAATERAYRQVASCVAGRGDHLGLSVATIACATGVEPSLVYWVLDLWETHGLFDLLVTLGGIGDACMERVNPLLVEEIQRPVDELL